MDSIPELNINIYIDKIKQIFLIYIIILIKLEILKINESIKIIYLFYKNNINLVSDKEFFISIFNTIQNLNEENLNIFCKYLTFVFIMGTIDNYNKQFLKLINESKLFKDTQKEIDVDNLQSNNLYHITDDFNNIKDELSEIKKYISSFEILNNKNNFLKQFLFVKNDSIKNFHKEEIINRLELLCNMIGYKLLIFILNKKNRKKKELNSIDNLELEIVTFNDLYNMEYNKLIKYCFLLFMKIDKNIDTFIQDFEFVKYLKIIVINYIDNNEDKITHKFHDKLLKKYVLI
jgi:hypothetical protein